MKFRSSYKWFLLTSSIMFLGLFWISVSTVPEGQADHNIIHLPREGFIAPQFTLTDQTGQKVNLSSFSGKIILLNFWASWCPPCKAEMPALQAVYDDYQDQNFEILAVKTTFQDQFDEANKFANINNLKFPVLFDLDGSISADYQISAMPTSFFIDKDGYIQDVLIGGPLSETLIRIRIQDLLQKNP